MSSNPLVKLEIGPSSRFTTLTKDPYTLYFLNDIHELYLGSEKYGFGQDTTIEVNGVGDNVQDVTWAESTKTLTITKGNGGDLPTVQSAIAQAFSQCIKTITTDRDSAILVDSTDPEHVELSLHIAEGTHAGNVVIDQCSDGLFANVELPDVPVKGVKDDDKIIKLVGDELESKLSITTEKDSATDKVYVVLKGWEGVEISRFDASDFVTAGMLQSVTLTEKVVEGEIHKFLVLTFYVEGGRTQSIELDIQDLVDAYKAAADGGLVLNATTNEFSIANNVESSAGVNTDKTLNYGSSVTLNTIKYDAHGLITGQGTYTLTLPPIFGSIGSSSGGKLVTYASIDNTGELVGQTIDIATSIDESATDNSIPTSKAVYDAVESVATRWNVF